jgi:hypothetical protein
VVSGVAPAKSYVALGEGNQPAVGNGNAVGVGAEIAQYVFWPAERALGVDDPVVTEQELLGTSCNSVAARRI